MQVEHQLREYPELPGCEEKTARLWRCVIEEALAERPERRRMVELRYFEGKSEERVQQMLPVGRTAYMRWRADFLATVAAKAAYWHLLQP